MTKLVTSVAVLQLVDRGLVDLDDAELIERVCPELAALPILTGMDGNKPITTPRTAPITLRRLLTHTSGLAYDFTSPLLEQWKKATNHPPHYGVKGQKAYCEPLVFQPGEKWLYSIGIDWAGIVVERVSGQDLEAYFHEHIFGPLGLTPKDVSFIPEDVHARIQQVCGRDENGKLKHTESLRPVGLDAESIGQLSGGGGLVGTAKAYMRFLQGILQREAGGIVSERAFKTLFTDSLESGDVRKGLAAMTMRQTYHDPEHTANDGQYLGHSVGLVLSLKDSVNGRKKGSGCWDGAAKTQYWLDPATGIAVSPGGKSGTDK